MLNPKIKTKVVHSKSKDAWNIVSTSLGAKFKIARVPYMISGHDKIDTKERCEALLHAEFISKCFNKSDEIISIIS